MRPVYVASDHAGFELKTKLLEVLPQLHRNFFWTDLGSGSLESVDYPDYADLVAQKISDNGLGLLICGSGQGMAMRANKFPKVRAAVVWSDDVAKLAREHNDANVLCLGARFCGLSEALRWIDIFLATPFGGGRHETRVRKISAKI